MEVETTFCAKATYLKQKKKKKLMLSATELIFAASTVCML